MKRQRLVLLFGGLLIFAIAWWLWQPTQPESPVTVALATPAPAPAPVQLPPAPTATPPQPIEAEPPPKGRYLGLTDPRWEWWNRMREADISFEWKMPINFYGVVRDQDETPIVGVKIEFTWNDLSKEGTSKEETVTDQVGEFRLIGKTGKGLGIRMSKDGYYIPRDKSSGNRFSFEYADFSTPNYYEPDEGNPVVFHLRKKGAGEALLIGRIEINTPANGAPVRVDFLNGGRVSPEGQLEISAVTDTRQYPPRIFDWRATLSVPGGGLLEYNDEFPFSAPEAGYLPQVQFSYPATAPDWKRSVQKRYYIRFGTPAKYGRVQIDLDGGRQLVFVRYWINPSGSPSLEPAAQQTSAR